MAKANVILLNSILWNLREVTKLTEKIKKHCGDVDCTSWRYPLTSCSELEIFKLLQNNRNLDSYTYILELTYDRLLYLFNLIIKYLESMDTMEKFRPSKNVTRPKTLSLASVLHMIWDRIQVQTESRRPVFVEKLEVNDCDTVSSEKELSASKSSICTQSEICSISLCSCCEMVQEFVTQLVIEMEKIMEKQEFCSAIANERKIMREYLVEMTSWSAMSRWLTAILKDFTTLSEKVDQVTTNSRKLRHRLESGDRKLKTKTEQHESEIRKLETKIKDFETKITNLKVKIDKLTEDKNNLKNELEQKNSELIETNSNFECKIIELKKNYENKLKEKKLKKDKETEELKKKLDGEYKKLELQNKTLEETIVKLQEDIQLLNSQTAEDKNTLMTRLKDLEEKIEDLQKENSSLTVVIEEKQKTIKDYSMRIMEAFPELHGVPTPTYKVFLTTKKRKPKQKRIVTTRRIILQRKRNKWVKCKFCNKRVKCRVLAKHTSKHTISVHHCEICGLACLNYVNLCSHILKKHFVKVKCKKIETERCWTCKKNFESPNALVEHVKTQHADECFDILSDFECTKCNKNYTDLFSWKIHAMLNHNLTTEEAAKVKNPKGYRLIQCCVCRKSFGSEKKIRAHMKEIHNMQNNEIIELLKQECERCGKKFVTKQTLLLHINAIHLNIRPITCELCGSKFTKKSSLIYHKWVHSREKNFKCVHCNLKFRQRNDVIRHIAKHVRDNEIPFNEACAMNVGSSAAIKKRKIYFKECKFNFKTIGKPDETKLDPPQ